MPGEPFNLFLQLFNSLHLTVSIALLVKLVRNQIAQLVLVIVPQSQHLLEISSLVVVNDILFFKLHDWLPDFGDVLVEHFPLQDREELWVVIHDSLPVGLPDRVTFALSMGPVDEDLPLVETNVESTDDGVLAQPQLELLSLVHLIADVVLSLFDEQNLIHLVKLNVNNLSWGKDPWLEVLQNIDHEVLVLDVVPCEERVVNPDGVIFISRLFGEVKELLEVVDERLEQEITVDLPLHVCWQLLQQFDVSLT